MRLRPGFAWLLAGTMSAIWLVGKISSYLSLMQLFHPGSPVGTVATGLVAITVLAATLILMMLRRGRPALLVGIQVVALLTPYPVVGQGWAVLGVGAVLCAGILLNLPGVPSGVLFALVAVGSAAIAGYLHQSVSMFAVVASLNAANGFLLFAVTRLLHLVRQTHDDRRQLVALEVRTERGRTAERVRTALGGQLTSIIQRVRDLHGSPALRATDTAAIAGLSRRAAADARSIANVHRDPPPVTPIPAPDPPGGVSYRFAWWVHLLLVIHTATVSFTNLFWEGGRSDLWLAAIATIAVAAAFQLYHGPPRAAGVVPRWWPLTLAAQILLSTTVTVAVFGDISLLGFILLAAAVAALRMRAPWSWCLPAAIMVFVFGFNAATIDPWFALYYALGVVYLSVAVYVLCNLPAVTAELRGTRRELARVAAVAERLRFARDVHDLLGFHLAAITLKTELAAQLVDRDPAAAREHLADALASAESALAELRDIAGVSVRVTCEGEVAAARALLESAAVTVTVTARPSQLPPAADHLLGIIVRESATNVVRHSRARTCTIAFTTGNGSVQVCVSNDGAPPLPRLPRNGGTGLANLCARVGAAGGQFHPAAGNGSFTITATIPLHRPAFPARSAGDLVRQS